MRRLVEGIINLAFKLSYRAGNIVVGERSRIDYWRLNGRGGSIVIGDDCMIHCRVDFDASTGTVTIGDRCFVGASHIVCHSGISIGDDVIMSWGVTIVDHNSHDVEWEGRKADVQLWAKGSKNWAGVKIAPVNIGCKVWVGFGASILKGVEIGEGAVIAAKSVVTRDVPPYTLVAGNPAMVVRELRGSP
jgi:acetyltransferase-like isoleucine patch superfamily enzyme